MFKKDTFGLGYVATPQDKEMQRLQDQKAIQAHKPFKQGQVNQNSKVIKMSEFNEDDVDIEDDADGEHMAQIYSNNTLKDHIKSEGALESYVNLKNE